MASTYSALKVELIGTGDQAGTWGSTTNTNLGTALEEAIVGRAAANFPADSDLTLTLTNSNTSQVARNYILNVVSSVALTTTRNLIVPTISKPYIIENNTSGGQSILVKTAAGTGITVPNGQRVPVYVDGTNVVTVVSGTAGVATFSAGTTGLTPSTATSGPVTLAGTLAPANGGTGASSLTGAGIVTTSNTQTISGQKSFTSNVNVNGIGGSDAFFNVQTFGAGFNSQLTIIPGSSGATIGVTHSTANQENLYLTAANNFFALEEAIGISFYTNSIDRMQVTNAGALILVGSTAQKATGTTWSNPSDVRLKDNIRDYTKGVDELMKVRVREWEFNGKGKTVEGAKGLGVIADEIMQVLPDTVETYEVKLNADDKEDTPVKKFDATEITWLLVKSVQEQQALIENLTARLTALEGK